MLEYLEGIPTIPLVLGFLVVAVLLTIFAPAVFAVIGLVTFLAVIIWHVPSPDLVMVISVVVLLAVLDFAREYRKQRRNR